MKLVGRLGERDVMLLLWATVIESKSNVSPKDGKQGKSGRGGCI